MRGRVPRERVLTASGSIPRCVRWRWLGTQLRKPAAVRVMCSSLSFAASYNGEEAWSLYPHERRRMLSLIESTRASGVVFLSGDVHYGEMSALTPADGSRSRASNLAVAALPSGPLRLPCSTPCLLSDRPTRESLV